MKTELPRRDFLASIGLGAAALGIACPLLAQTNSPTPTPAPANPTAESPEIARLRRQLDAQRDGMIRMIAAIYQEHGSPIARTVGAFVEARSKENYARRKVAGPRDLAALKAELWDKLDPTGFEWEVVENTPERLRFKVKRCRPSELMKQIGVPPELGYALNCASDPGIAAGINPAIKFSRTQTLMQGHSCCDHCYELAGAAPATT